MEEQDILNTETGDKEAVSLKPTTVKIVSVSTQEVGEKKNTKLVCSVKHPDRDEPVNISSVKFENKGKLDVVGLWVNLDEDKKLRKGSALAVLMAFAKASSPKGLVDKEVMTAEDDKGYLCFKAY